MRVGTVAELEVRDWRVVRAEGDLAQPYKPLAEIALREAREMSDYQRRSLLIKELEDFDSRSSRRSGRRSAKCRRVPFRDEPCRPSSRNPARKWLLAGFF